MSENKDLRKIGIAVMIPFALAIPPLLGWRFGLWIDKHLDIHLYFRYILLILGFLAGARECYRLIKKYDEDMD